MSERTLEILIGVLRLGFATGLTLATARRWAPLLIGGRAAASERLLATALAAALLAAWTAAALGFAGVLHARGLVLAALGLHLLTLWLGPRPRGRGPLSASGPRARPFLWPLLLATPIVCADLLAHLPLPPTAWDAMTYHLYLPARWLQEGRIFHIPTVFGDNAAAFAPQNGALLFAWQLGLLGGDALANGWAVLAAIALAVALYRSGVAWGVGRESAALVAAAVFWLPPLRSLIYTATVDVLMLTAWLLAVHWMLACFDARRRSALLACGLACGFAAGTKVVGVPLVAAPAMLVAALLLRRRAYAPILGFGAAAIAAGGWWYLRNLWLYANPLFPLELRLGPLPIAAGAYEYAAVAGQFHGSDKLQLAGLVLRNWGVPACALAVLGLLALARAAADKRLRQRGVLLVLASALYWLWFHFWRLPHNTETRFLLPVLLLALLGCMLPLDRLRRRSRWPARGVWLAVLLAAADRPDREWRGALATLADAGAGVAVWLGVGIFACVGVAAAARIARGGARRRAAALVIALAAAALVVAQIASERSRDAAFAGSRFERWAGAYRFIDAQGTSPALHIAYTGVNLPYPLMGPGFVHRVVYCNTQGRAEDGFYEFWLRDPGPHGSYKPGLYRGADDYAIWLRHLEAAQIDLVAIFALHRQERRYIWSTPQGFPIERVWVQQHPERFEPLFTNRSVEIYRLKMSEQAPEGRAKRGGSGFARAGTTRLE